MIYESTTNVPVVTTAGTTAYVPAIPRVVYPTYVNPEYHHPRWVRDPRGYMVDETPVYGVPHHPLHHQTKPDGYWVVKSDKIPPKNPPSTLTPGQWVTLNSGWGAPPVYGFLATESGLESTAQHHSDSAGSSSNVKGHYVSVKLSHETEGFVWVPEIDSSFGTK
jgi:hypothetical protein